MTLTREDLIENKWPLVPIMGDGNCAIYAAFIAWILGPIEGRQFAREEDIETFGRLPEAADFMASFRSYLGLPDGYLEIYDIAKMLTVLESVCPLDQRIAIEQPGFVWVVGSVAAIGATICFLAPYEGADGNHWDIVRKDVPRYFLEDSVDLKEEEISYADVHRLVTDYLSANKAKLIDSLSALTGADQHAIAARIEAILCY